MLSRHLLPIVLLLACCAPASTRFAEQAQDLGLQAQKVPGTAFTHSLFVKPASGGTPATLHVYLGGDGTPTVLGLPADDPTPRNPLTLRLLARDPGRALYLGRPCYHGDGPVATCTSSLWTDGRYAEPVIASMAAALRAYLRRHPAQALWWFGYSGGGALAMLLAERFPETEAVVTIAGNLDLAAFAQLHAGAGLPASLDPTTRPPMPAAIFQRHYLGTHDPVVPFSARIARVAVAGFDHRCCWQALWPAILADTEEAVSARRAAAAVARDRS